MNVLLILGNQLFSTKHFPKVDKKDVLIFMREDSALCTHFKYHKQKIIFFLSAMRKYAQELKDQGYSVHYEVLGEDKNTYQKSLADFLKANNPKTFFYFEVEDKFFEMELNKTLKSFAKIKSEPLTSPMFLTSRELFSDYVKKTKKPFMKNFYQAQRKRLKILIDAQGEPEGGQWSFDEDNRLSLPKDYTPPSVATYKMDKTDLEVARLVEQYFPDHIGNTQDVWLPTDRASAQKWLERFLEERLEDFGPYEDAMSKDFPFINHSVLSPFMNVGLLTPEDVIRKTLQVAKKQELSLNSVEGFVRQIIGWREFIRGIYQNFSDQQESTNFFGHKRKLKPCWYEGNTGIEPLDDVILKTQKYAYAHHIERLMVVGSLMLLLEVEPQEAHRWFMEMFIDSSDWVMGPNVYGMALFSDGGIFATKPYFCGSNYYKKMGPYKKGDWQDGVDGLYWGFIDRNRKFFAKNPRLSMMVKTFDKMDSDKKTRIAKAAKKLREQITG